MAWSNYLASTRAAMDEVAARFFAADEPADDARRRDPDRASIPTPRSSWSRPMLYPHTHLPEAQVERRVRAMSADERLDGGAGLRRGAAPTAATSPGRALERLDYRFDVLADYGAFRDLQRHRMLTIEWQPLSPRHGYTRPEAVDLAGARRRVRRGHGALGARSTTLLVDRFPAQAPYAVCLAYKVRFVMQMNAREAMHLLELRSAPAGPPGLPARWPRRCTASSPPRPGTRPSPR